MQNIDFYKGKNNRVAAPKFDPVEPEYFTIPPVNMHKEEEKKRKKVNRMIFLIISLCIVSFTVGMVMGIKFAAASKKEIVDKDTKKAVKDIGEKVSHLIKDVSNSDNSKLASKKIFTKSEFPFAIKVGKDYNRSKSHQIASFLSNKGYTVILSKNDKYYRIYTGPYRNLNEAELNLKKIEKYYSHGLPVHSIIVKR
ncbi:MAG: SPOR domain-containing protein [Spirochaetota bacterium]|nr:SPOR domain-containing protein [Spirochaetota bacterium]